MNIEKRMKWDDRWHNVKLLTKKGCSTVIYYEGAKPPTTLGRRDYVVEYFQLENGAGPGRHCLLSKSIQTEKCPEQSLLSNGLTYMQRGNIVIRGCIFEKNPDGPGTKYTHMRIVDMLGYYP